MKISKTKLKKIIKEEINKVLKERTAEGGATAEEFLTYLQLKSQSIKTQKGADELVGVGASLIPVVGSLGSIARAVKAAAALANEKKLSRAAYVDNPFLAYLDFDEQYEKVINGKVFEEFLDQVDTQIEGMGVGKTDPMPDIDKLLVEFIKGTYGITVSGAKANDEEFAGAKAASSIDYDRDQVQEPAAQLGHALGAAADELTPWSGE